MPFPHAWSPPRDLRPERELALAVLRQALMDLRKHRGAAGERWPRQYQEAYEWVVSEDRTWPYSFLNLCDVLGISASSLRAAVVSPLCTTDGIHDAWARQ